ncbi:MAG: hypothetical protein NTV86_08850 [Planctomycetota bacterium]|nr:hypothetical protein [Planctomycetota bacterium]
MKQEGIKQFIRSSVRAENDRPDMHELERLLGDMSTEALQLFWAHFAADWAYSGTVRVPYWKTRAQERILKDGLVRIAFHPKKMDKNGKGIFAREDLVDHIKTHLIEYIGEERQRREEYKNRPFSRKIVPIVGSLVIVAVVPVMICSVLAPKWRAASEILLASLLGLYILSGICASTIDHWKSWRLSKKTAK